MRAMITKPFTKPTWLDKTPQRNLLSLHRRIDAVKARIRDRSLIVLSQFLCSWRAISVAQLLKAVEHEHCHPQRITYWQHAPRCYGADLSTHLVFADHIVA